MSGSCTTNVAPPPGVGSCHSRPPCACDDRRDDRQPEPGPAAVPRAAGIGAVEAVEDAGAVLAVDARAVVHDAAARRPPSGRGERRPRPASRPRVWTRTLASRLPTTWRSRSSSPVTVIPSARRCRRSAAPARRPARRSTASRTSRLRSTRSARSGRPWSSRARSSRSSTSSAIRRLSVPIRSIARSRSAGSARPAGAVQVGIAADGGQRRAELVRGVGDEPSQPLLAAGLRVERRLLGAEARPRSGRASRRTPCPAGRPPCRRGARRRGATGRRPRSPARCRAIRSSGSRPRRTMTNAVTTSSDHRQRRRRASSVRIERAACLPRRRSSARRSRSTTPPPALPGERRGTGSIRPGDDGRGDRAVRVATGCRRR